MGLAQTATGSIGGVIQDESGAVIPGAHVMVKNAATGIENGVTTDSSGRFHVPSLNPGPYQVQAQMSGFETTVRSGLQLAVGSNLEIPVVLKVGQVTEKTEVSAEAPMVETATSSVSALVDDKVIRDLPLNGRSFDQLISLESSSPTFRGGSHSSATGAGDVYTVNGARIQSNHYLIDGTEMLGGGNSTTLPGGALGKNMGVDAIQEFSVLTSNYSAAYGKKGGGIINIATRSGTNQIHGSVFEFFRNSALDARNFFDRTPKPPPFKRNNFGGAIGGPIRKDRSFFFGNYEGLIESVGLTSLFVVPDADAHRGFILTNGQLVNVGLNPAVKPYLDALYPLPNSRIFGDGTGEYISNPNQPSRQDFFLVRFDHRISDKDSLFARYNFTQASLVSPDNVCCFATHNNSRDQILTIEEKRAYATTVNLLRFGLTRAYTLSTSLPESPLPSSLNFLPSADTVGQITFTGTGVNAGPISRSGSGNSVDRRLVANQFDVSDQLYHYRGPHSLQFGIQVQRIQHNDNNAQNLIRGIFQFSGLQGFLAGSPTQFQGASLQANDAHKSWRQVYLSAYAQDDYKIRRNLTLNLGLRYEVLTVPAEASGNRVANYHYSYINGFRVIDAQPAVGAPYFASNRDAFAPRIGLAWDPTGSGRTSVRAGYGMFFDQMDSDFRFFASRNPPFYTALQVANPSFPNGFTRTATAPLTAPDAIDTDFKVPTRLQYNLGIQRQVTNSTVVTVGYVGSHSYHLTREFEGNPAVPDVLSGGTYFYPAGQPRLQPALSFVQFIATDANGFYNSLQFDFVQRQSHGIRYKVSYTFSRSTDEASKTIAIYANGEPTGNSNPFVRANDRGLSAFDVRNSFVLNFDYEVPWKHVSGFTGRVLGGWQVGGIMSLQSGTPFTAITGFNRSRDLNRNSSERPNLKPGASNNPILGGPDRYFDATAFELPAPGFYGNLGRNTLIGPGFENVNVTLTKNTTITERLRVDFRAEFFNLLNRANFAQPATAGAPIFAANGTTLGAAGRIQATVNSSRQIQFGLKLQF